MWASTRRGTVIDCPMQQTMLELQIAGRIISKSLLKVFLLCRILSGSSSQCCLSWNGRQQYCLTPPMAHSSVGRALCFISLSCHHRDITAFMMLLCKLLKEAMPLALRCEAFLQGAEGKGPGAGFLDILLHQLHACAA